MTVHLGVPAVEVAAMMSVPPAGMVEEVNVLSVVPSIPHAIVGLMSCAEVVELKADERYISSVVVALFASVQVISRIVSSTSVRYLM